MPAAAHPYFLSPLRWHTHLDEAQTEAASTNKLVLVVHGRATCVGTRGLVERALSKEEITDLLGQRFVLCASDADHPSEVLTRVIDSLPKREPTPLCIYLSPDGGDKEVLFSTAGGRPPAVVVNDLLQAWAKRVPRPR